jgi:hypothetical protein
MTEEQDIAGEVMYRMYLQACDYAERYQYIISEFSDRPVCFGCLVNAIDFLLSEEEEINHDTVARAYAQTAPEHTPNM